MHMAEAEMQKQIQMIQNNKYPLSVVLRAILSLRL